MLNSYRVSRPEGAVRTMQMPDNREHVGLSVEENSEFSRLTAIFEVVEEHVLDPEILTQVYSG